MHIDRQSAMKSGKTQIHTVVDRFLPRFLDEKKTGLVPYSKRSLYPMEKLFSATQVRRRKRGKLTEIFRRYGTPKPERTASQLQEYAKAVLSTPAEYI